jgi:anaerobic magnesium-protoporphyrin IX monomethyl ester cyclase
MDIMFVHASASSAVYQDLSKNCSAIEPPIWAAMLANHCRHRELDVAICDAEAERYTMQQAAQAIMDAKPKIACFVVYGQQPSASTQNMYGAVNTAKLLKQVEPDIITVFVGGHMAALPKEVLMSHHDCVDYICQNEGVYTISNLAQAVKNGTFDASKIAGLGYMHPDGYPVLNVPEKVVSRRDLATDLPGMAWDLLPDISKYRTAGWHSWTNGSEKTPFAALYTSLGCPYRCSFCMINIINRTDNSDHITSADSNMFRYWSPEFIIQQFDQIAAMGVKNVKIADELFVLNPRHFLKICDLLIERDYGFNIWAYSRIDTCKPEYLEKLKRAGVNWLALGIENPDNVLRSAVHKDAFEEVNIQNVMANIRDAGINIAANYIFGLPMDTIESMEKTLEFALSNITPMANFYSAMAYPGSPLYLAAKQNGYELPSTYTGYSQHAYDTLNLCNENLSSAKILAARDLAWSKYHANPKYLDLIAGSFGLGARKDIISTCKVKLKRKLLEEKTTTAFV